MRIFIIFLCIVWSACNPAIHSFTTDQITISSEDTVTINWDVRGKDSLLITQYTDSTTLTPSNNLDLKITKKANCAVLIVHGKNIDSINRKSSIIGLTLVVSKRGKEVHQSIELIVLPNTSMDEVVFATTSVTSGGDTVIAAGEKNKVRWDEKFRLMMVASASNRIIVAKHNNKSVSLEAMGNYVNDLKGEPLEGWWELRSPLTEAERADMTQAPEKLRLKVIIKYTNENENIRY